MPRGPRKKSDDSLYHIMCRSISEIDLFQDEADKLKYLELIKRYIDKKHCKLYAYILMDNHVHFFINPCGYDISSFMKCLNTAYVCYFNKIHNRHGHLFQGRYASTIVDNDIYGLALTAYIHNNAKDIPGFAGHEEDYRFSSYAIYIGKRNDTEGLIESKYILDAFSSDLKSAQNKYFSFTNSMKETGIMKEVNKNIVTAYTENIYNSEKKYITRHRVPKELLEVVGRLLGESTPEFLKLKYSRENSRYRAFSIYVMRTLCDYTYKEICRYIGNMSMSGVRRLSNEGFKLLKEYSRFREAFNSLIQAS